MTGFYYELKNVTLDTSLTMTSGAVQFTRDWPGVISVLTLGRGDGRTDIPGMTVEGVTLWDEEKTSAELAAVTGFGGSIAFGFGMGFR